MQRAPNIPHASNGYSYVTGFLEGIVAAPEGTKDPQLPALIGDRLARFDHNDIRARNARFAGFCAAMSGNNSQHPDEMREVFALAS